MKIIIGMVPKILTKFSPVNLILFCTDCGEQINLTLSYEEVAKNEG